MTQARASLPDFYDSAAICSFIFDPFRIDLCVGQNDRKGAGSFSSSVQVQRELSVLEVKGDLKR